MKALVRPVVTTRHDVKLSLDELRKRVAGKPNVVRVGLPDNKDTRERASAQQRSRKRGKGRTA
jgi:hypothetical protein